jgi:hypothetical protein
MDYENNHKALVGGFESLWANQLSNFMKPENWRDLPNSIQEEILWDIDSLDYCPYDSRKVLTNTKKSVYSPSI